MFKDLNMSAVDNKSKNLTISKAYALKVGSLCIFYAAIMIIVIWLHGKGDLKFKGFLATITLIESLFSAYIGVVIRFLYGRI